MSGITNFLTQVSTATVLGNTWYYTLSTIAQTLSALLGLSAVFLVMKLGNIEKNINDHKWRGLSLLNTNNPKETNKNANLSAKEVANKLKKFHCAGDVNILVKLYTLVSQYEFNITLSKLEQPPAYAERTELIENFAKKTQRNIDFYLKERGGILSDIKEPSLLALSVIVVSILLLSLGGLISTLSLSRIFVGALIVVVILTISTIFKLGRAAYSIFSGKI
ncbi:MAG: hypothetical protein Q7R86_00865 [bacterium]|nr:hypothetical protein [bacterium]